MIKFHQGKKGLVFIAISIFLIAFYNYCSSSNFNDTGKIWGINFNYMAFAISFLGAAVVALIVYTVSIVLEGVLSKRAACITLSSFYSLFMIGIICWIYKVYMLENTEFSGTDLAYSFFREQVVSKAAYFAIMLCICLSSTIIFGAFTNGKKEKKKIIRVGFCLIIGFVASMLTFAPNPYRNNMWGAYHADAYINSIINVAHYVPYSDSMTSIYGHYGIVYLPFVKVFGDNLTAVAFTISLFVFLLYLAVGYIADYLVENDLLYCMVLIGVGGIGTTFFGMGQYWQVYPHRMLFPVLTLALIVFDTKRTLSVNKKVICYFLLAVLSLVFNIETGFVCMVVISVYVILIQPTIKMKFLGAISSLLYVVISFLTSFLIVNAYNLICGGYWNSIATFVFPIGSDIYNMFEILRAPLSDGCSIFIIPLVIFCSSIFFGLFEYVVDRKNEQRNVDIQKLPVIISVALCGLGLFTYYMDRPAPSCLGISHVNMILLLGTFSSFPRITMEKIKSIFSDSEIWFSKGIKTITCVLLVYFAFEAIIGLGGALSDRNKTVWQIKSFNNSIEEVKKSIPENTMGLFVGEIYYQLGWKNMVYTIDGADMNEIGISAIKDAIKEQDLIVVNEAAKNLWSLSSEDEGFVLDDTLITNDFTLLIYRRGGK